MERKKKAALIIGGIILVGVVAAIVISKTSKKTAPDEPGAAESDGKKDEPGSPSTPSTSTKPKNQPTTQQTPSGGQAPSLTRLADVLATNIKGAFGKGLYALRDGDKIYNMANSVAGTTKKNQLLGVVSEARKSVSTAHVVHFMKGQVKFWVTDVGNFGIK